MEVMGAVQSGTLLHALRVQLKRRVSARRGGDYNEVPQAIQKKSRPFLGAGMRRLTGIKIKQSGLYKKRRDNTRDEAYQAHMHK